MNLAYPVNFTDPLCRHMFQSMTSHNGLHLDSVESTHGSAEPDFCVPTICQIRAPKSEFADLVNLVPVPLPSFHCIGPIAVVLLSWFQHGRCGTLEGQTNNKIAMNLFNQFIAAKFVHLVHLLWRHRTKCKLRLAQVTIK